MLGDDGYEENDIAQIYEACIQFQVGQYCAHHSLKSGRSIFKPKGHHFKLLQLISCYKRRFFSRQPAKPTDYWSAVTTTLFFMSLLLNQPAFLPSTRVRGWWRGRWSPVSILCWKSSNGIRVCVRDVFGQSSPSIGSSAQ